MSPVSLSDLVLKAEDVPDVAYDTLPTFGWAPPPQPGAYRFKLPDMTASIYEPFEIQGGGQRLRIIFDSAHPLVIVGVPHQSPTKIGDTFETRITNAERARGKAGVEASDVDYLLKAFGHTTRPKGQALLQALADLSGKEFGGDISYSWTCNAERKIRVLDANGKNVEGTTMGCGRKYYMDSRTGKVEQKIMKDAAGLYPYEIACSGVAGNPCGNIVRAFANLENLRA
jgi:hypothetical protein